MGDWSSLTDIMPGICLVDIRHTGRGRNPRKGVRARIRLHHFVSPVYLLDCILDGKWRLVQTTISYVWRCAESESAKSPTPNS